MENKKDNKSGIENVLSENEIKNKRSKSKERKKKESKRNIGNAGENIAVNYLTGLGYKLLERNFKSKRQGGYEIDIIMTKGVVIVFVEVKYRRQGCFGEASYSITEEKKRRLYQAAEEYMSLNGIDVFSKCVFSAVLIDDTILGRKISFVENIFL